MNLATTLKQQVVSAKIVTVTYDGQTFPVAETWLKKFRSSKKNQKLFHIEETEPNIYSIEPLSFELEGGTFIGIFNKKNSSPFIIKVDKEKRMVYFSISSPAYGDVTDFSWTHGVSFENYFLRYGDSVKMIKQVEL